MEKEDYIRCATELKEHFRGSYQISRAGCLFAAIAIEELLDRAEKAEKERDSALAKLEETRAAMGGKERSGEKGE